MEELKHKLFKRSHLLQTYQICLQKHLLIQINHRWRNLFCPATRSSRPTVLKARRLLMIKLSARGNTCVPIPASSPKHSPRQFATAPLTQRIVSSPDKWNAAQMTVSLTCNKTLCSDCTRDKLNGTLIASEKTAVAIRLRRSGRSRRHRRWEIVSGSQVQISRGAGVSTQSEIHRTSHLNACFSPRRG